MSPSVSAVPESPAGRLFDGGWLAPVGVTGAFSCTPKFERVVSWLEAVLTVADPAGSPGPQVFPPLMSRMVIERAEYAAAFPHLLGTVGTYPGGPGDADTVLMPAVCYGVYQELADTTVDGSRQFDVTGYCHRHEATSELGRFRTFRMREFVLVADAPAALRWRDDWIDRGRHLFSRLGLPVKVEPASDPFFGPGSDLLRDSQIGQSLKWEFVVPLTGEGPGTAIASANSHKDHLGKRFGIRYRDAGPAHSSCVAFGLERIVLAMIHAHGDDPAAWPEPV